jgi:hypothetical protein
VPSLFVGRGQAAPRPINRADALGSFNQQCPCAAADIQNSLVWLEVRQVKYATPEISAHYRALLFGSASRKRVGCEARSTQPAISKGLGLVLTAETRGMDLPRTLEPNRQSCLQARRRLALPALASVVRATV